MNAPVPQSLRGDQESLSIVWSDGRADRITWRQLREACPCATCKVKRETPPPMFAVLKPAETQPIKCTRMEPAGNYAYHVDFSDGHHSGIFSFDFLRKLGESTGSPG